MRVLLLAAGRGTRLHPLTQDCPKPLVQVGDKPLIVWHLEQLAQAGITEIVINTAYLGEKIRAYLGSGTAWGVHLEYSIEDHLGGLETGGGIMHALPLLSPQKNTPFIVINADIWTQLPLKHLLDIGQCWQQGQQGFLYMVRNPEHHPQGDFYLSQHRLYTQAPHADAQTFTFAGISVLHPDLFNQGQQGAFPLAPLLRQASSQGHLYGTQHLAPWFDVGTVERLQQTQTYIDHHILH
ncbi:MurNAc alpha-1-phosphate uridylyltransferase [Allopseudospirillum japonicum]|uniref:MurNAc alpha-1-phosphate uridylyltransferase n=1 Tax=Allopseudospirillum japonicum TaxID=64971 RepID=A0A1H6TF37_9GAMM|nr:nucleotidyltransferase family protein [Allopseudospirillum japonicum]SEI74855.1 MurNAc alpha-1-phosphate uridylyltransferase [Allopseudospirillum japonicum]